MTTEDTWQEFVSALARPLACPDDADSESTWAGWTDFVELDDQIAGALHTSLAAGRVDASSVKGALAVLVARPELCQYDPARYDVLVNAARRLLSP